MAEVRTIAAEDLKCGDRIKFHGINYVVLSCFTDTRHTQTIVTCRGVGHQEANIVYVLRLIRTFLVDVIGDREELSLILRENTDEEVMACRNPWR